MCVKCLLTASKYVGLIKLVVMAMQAVSHSGYHGQEPFAPLESLVLLRSSRCCLASFLQIEADRNVHRLETHYLDVTV